MNTLASVPDTLATLTCIPVSVGVPVAGPMRHAKVVSDVHDDVAHEYSSDAKLAVGVRSVGAKAMPVTVAVSPPDEGALLLPTRAKLTTGPGVGKVQIMNDSHAH